MTHAITALVLKGEYDHAMAAGYDLFGQTLGYDLTLFHIDRYYTAYWQHMLGTVGPLPGSPDWNERNDWMDYGIIPRQRVSAELMCRISLSPPPLFALINTQYYAGMGDQWGRAYYGHKLVPQYGGINMALLALGVKTRKGYDEFDTVGLSKLRDRPRYLDKYADLVEDEWLDEDLDE